MRSWSLNSSSTTLCTGHMSWARAFRKGKCLWSKIELSEYEVVRSRKDYLTEQLLYEFAQARCASCQRSHSADVFRKHGFGHHKARNAFEQNLPLVDNMFKHTTTLWSITVYSESGVIWRLKLNPRSWMKHLSQRCVWFYAHLWLVGSLHFPV